MKCLMKYQWIKLPRNRLPEGKGIMSSWAKLASRAAYRKGNASYCGHINPVSPGMWSGGVVGLKSILKAKNRIETIRELQKLTELGYLIYHLDSNTKKLTYQIVDWVVKCSGKECKEGSVYATDGYGFLCIPRNITERLAEKKIIFGEADAWMDLWCHTASKDPNNAFSFLAPTVQYGRYGAALTLDTLGQRWGWEKTKVWRFLKKHGDVFKLHRLPSSYGCLIFNIAYPSDTEGLSPDYEQVVRILDEIRILGANTQKRGTENEHINRLITWYSRKLHEQDEETEDSEIRVAVSAPITRAYFSHCRNCKNCRYDCTSKNISLSAAYLSQHIRGPCEIVDLTKIAKEYFTHEQTGR